MIFNAPIPRAPQPSFGEGSSLASNRDSRSVARSWTTLKAASEQVAGLSKAVGKISHQLSQTRRRIVGGGVPFAFPWQAPNKELDPTVFVPAGTWVYLSPGNALVTTGLFDLVSGSNTTARSGIWQSAQDVPAQVVNPSGMPDGTYYNVPQLPYPGATGTPTGTPLKGDLDGSNVYWIFISATPYC